MAKSMMFATLLTMLATGPAAAQSTAQSVRRDYPGCDLRKQHRLRAPTGGTIRDPRQAHIAMRANILQADISNARKARRLTQAQAQTLWQQVDRVRRDTNAAVSRQGFLSGGELASYDRALDMVAARLCR